MLLFNVPQIKRRTFERFAPLRSEGWHLYRRVQIVFTLFQRFRLIIFCLLGAKIFFCFHQLTPLDFVSRFTLRSRHFLFLSVLNRCWTWILVKIQVEPFNASFLLISRLFCRFIGEAGTIELCFDTIRLRFQFPFWRWKTFESERRCLVFHEMTPGQFHSICFFFPFCNIVKQSAFWSKSEHWIKINVHWKYLWSWQNGFRNTMTNTKMAKSWNVKNLNWQTFEFLDVKAQNFEVEFFLNFGLPSS